MSNILICSIVRNQEANLNLWHNQLIELSKLLDGKIYLSVFENDSLDKTKELLEKFSYPFESIVTCKNFNKRFYGSVWNLERLKNLAFYRQACIDQAFEKWKEIFFTKVVYIEPDIEYDPKWSCEIIKAQHPLSLGINPDIYSGWSLRSNNHPKESFYLYDTCASRQYEKDTCWNFENEKEWNERSLLKTDFGVFNSNCLHSVYSTFNCFCAYNAKPFYEGMKWGFSNSRINASNIVLENGDFLEADTVNIVEQFRSNNYNNVYINKNCIIRHL
jgi:hypothetical protein